MAELRLTAQELLSDEALLADGAVRTVIEGVDKDNIDAVKAIIHRRIGSEAEEMGGVIAIEPVALTQRVRFNFPDVYRIMKILRGEGGCQWDMAQSHESIRSNMIEEAYELVEAIDNRDIDNMEEECGDVLLQSVFHAVMAEEGGEFDICDVITRLCRKLIDRHTHIFGDVKADNAEQALIAWDNAKAKEKKYTAASSKMDSVGKAMPALIKAYKVGKAAAKVGFDFKDAVRAGDKVGEELAELLSADDTHIEDEGGDLLFAVVNVLRLKGVEPEVALKGATDKFIKRFKYLEVRTDISSASDKELDRLWQEAKGAGL
ncbi:MAG: nucleoside triphosphate pyrophosphohydrolase [Clostridia bacterium]|nr:nucleoside triphosphate pyrophosphohydrolase [Clostridia bacterium]